MSDDPPELGEIVNFDSGQPDDRRWLLLFDEDYDDVVHDLEDNLGVLVDIQQAGEILRLAAEIVADLSHRDAEADDVIGDMIDALEDLEGDS